MTRVWGSASFSVDASSCRMCLRFVRLLSHLYTAALTDILAEVCCGDPQCVEPLHRAPYDAQAVEATRAGHCKTQDSALEKMCLPRLLHVIHKGFLFPELSAGAGNESEQRCWPAQIFATPAEILAVLLKPRTHARAAGTSFPKSEPSCNSA